MAEILIYLVPRKYRSIGHFLVGFGGFMIIIFGMIFFYLDYLIILGHCCLLIGMSGTYFRKTKNFRSVRTSEEKEGIEQKSLNGISRKFSPQKYVFYIISIVGIIFILISWIPYEWRYIQGWMDVGGGDSYIISSLIYGITIPYLIGYLPLIGGLLILYFKKRREYWYRLEDLPMSYRFAKRLKCKDCGNIFKSKIMQCPFCDGKDLKMMWNSR